MNAEVLKSWGKDLTYVTLLLSFALIPLPVIDGNPTGVKLVLNEWHRHKDAAIVEYIVSLNVNSVEHAIKMDEIKAAEFEYVSHKWTKPKRGDYEDRDLFKDDLDTWREESQELKEKKNKLKMEKRGLITEHRSLLAHSTKMLSGAIE